jgi:serine/threonine protein kinase
MNVVVNGSHYRDPAPLMVDGRAVKGGEGAIYELNHNNLAKIYHPDEQTTVRRKKVLALCNAYRRNIAEFGQECYAFPQFPAYLDNVDNENIAGFSMPYFHDCKHIEDVEFSLTDGKFAADKSGAAYFTDKSAVDLIYRLFELVEHLHKGRIILGDINPKNILYNPQHKCPVIVDLDSAMVDLHPATAMSQANLDPIVERQSKTAGGKFYFSTRSDVFGLACIAFRFFVGVSPFKMVLSPPLGVEDLKRKGISMIRYIVEGAGFLSSLGHTYVPSPINTLVAKRIEVLRQIDKALFPFFYSTFAQNSRESLLYGLPEGDPRHPSNILFIDPGIRKDFLRRKADRAARIAQQRAIAPIAASQPREVTTANYHYRDPEELALFLDTFGLSIKSMFS